MCELLPLNSMQGFIGFPGYIILFDLKECILKYIQAQNKDSLYLKIVHKYPLKTDILILIIKYNFDFQHYLHFENHQFQLHSSQIEITKLPAHL